ncbi:hypothetical protein [Streptomyces sp. NPDC046197]|uniref:hypothetical protein n=1 Tax=Streptomyces sp. NPDC046197 TaxID=3154337 RepID=UPI0033C2B7A5
MKYRTLGRTGIKVRQNYGCGNGGYLYGYPNKTAALWTTSYLAPNSGAGVSTPISTVYQ